MKLLIVEPGLKLWGSEKALLFTIPDLVRFNDSVVALVADDSELVPYLESLRIKIIRAPIANLHRKGLIARLRAVLAIAQACLIYKVDKIYLNQAGLCKIVYCVALIMRRRLAIHIRLLEDIQRCARLPGWLPIDLIFVSSDMRRRHPEDALYGKRLVWAYDPYELQSDKLPIVDHPRERTRFFCCVGRIDPSKGQRELIAAIVKNLEFKNGFTLDFIGAPTIHDNYYTALIEQAEPLVRQKVVRFLGYQREIHNLLQNYRFVVVPSRYESLGRVVMEAWDAGAVPICSRDAGGCSEMVIRSGGGILYDGHEPDAISTALAEATAMSEIDRSKLVERGRAWVRNNLSCSAYRTALEGVVFS